MRKRHRAPRAQTGLTRYAVALLITSIALSAPAVSARAEQPPRPMPNYDGREQAPPDAAEVALWVPRLIFAPVYLVTEYVIRWPLGTFVTWLERERIIEKSIRVFTFGTGGDVGLVPTALIDFGFRPSIGLYLWASGAFQDDDFFSTHFAWGGRDWWRVSVRQRTPLGSRERAASRGVLSGAPFELVFHFLLDYRPDLLFYGIGPAADGPKSRFYWDQLGGSVGLLVNLSGFGEAGFGTSGLDGFLLTFETRRNDFGGGDAESGEVPINEGFDVSDPTAVPGYDGYVLGSARLDVLLDSRDPRPEPGSGVRLELFGELAADLADTDRFFASYGGEVSLFLDLTGWNNTLSARQYVGLMEEIGSEPIPFAEMYFLGGVELMRGFKEGRYRGESALVTTLQYSYPIWVFLDGYLFVDMGNVFGPHLDGVDIDNMALSFGMGIKSSSERDTAFELLVGAGTARFGSPNFGVDTVTVLFGTTRGF